MSLWVVYGKGRCAGCFVYVLGFTAEHAEFQLTSDGFSPFYEVERVEPFTIIGGTP